MADEIKKATFRQRKYVEAICKVLQIDIKTVDLNDRKKTFQFIKEHVEAYNKAISQKAKQAQ